MNLNAVVPAVVAATLALAGCHRMEASAQTAVRENLKDPDSARFGDFYLNEKLHRACITVNAKNSMGGYTGNHQARLTKTKDGWDFTTEVEESQDDCKRRWADNSEIAD